MMLLLKVGPPVSRKIPSSYVVLEQFYPYTLVSTVLVLRSRLGCMMENIVALVR